jgi:hypothetical protein
VAPQTGAGHQGEEVDDRDNLKAYTSFVTNTLHVQTDGSYCFDGRDTQQFGDGPDCRTTERYGVQNKLKRQVVCNSLENVLPVAWGMAGRANRNIIKPE